MNKIVGFLKQMMQSGLGAPILLLAMLAMVIIPMPPLMLDTLFTFNIALALMVLLAAVYVSRPLDFGVFPTILLIATLMRLALNVASTRVVLLEGQTGTDAAGKVIEAFGEFVIDLAIATRCCSPPDNWAGLCLTRSFSPTFSNNSTARIFALL